MSEASLFGVVTLVSWALSSKGVSLDPTVALSWVEIKIGLSSGPTEFMSGGI